MSAISIRSFLAALPVTLASAVVLACCMVPTTYPGDVDQVRQDGLVLFHDGHEELIVRVAPVFPDFDYGPPRLAWLVAVPSHPTGYDVIDADIFESAQRLYQRLESLADAQRPRDKSNGILASDGSTLEDEVAPGIGSLIIDDAVEVGPYEITAVRAAGEDGPRALNLYLEKRGFPAESPEELSWFTSRGFSFLCIDARPPEGVEFFGKTVDLPALQIGFDSVRPYYPAKYSMRQGNFALALNVISSEPLARASLREVISRIHGHPGPYANLFTTRELPGLVADAATKLSQARAPRTGSLPPVFNRAFRSRRRKLINTHSKIGPMKHPMGDCETVSSW